MRTLTPYQSHPYGGGWRSENIQYLICLRKHICISWKKNCFWKITGYSGYIIYIFHKICIKKRKTFSRHIFSWNAYCSTAILFSSFKKLTISKRCCTMEKKVGATTKNLPRNFLEHQFYGSTQKWVNSVKAIRLITHILF